MISCALLCLARLLVFQPAPGDLERKFREGNEAARLELLRSLDTDDPAVARQAMPVLIQALGDDSSAVRAEAAFRLIDTNAQGSAAIPALCRCLEDRDIHVRRRAAAAICTIARQPEVAVPALRQALRDPDFEKGTQEANVPHRAAQALGEYGPAAREAYPELLRIMKTHEDKSFRRCALIALGQIKVNPDQVIAEALAILDNAKEEDLWYAGFVTLRVLGEKGKPAVPGLLTRFAAREAKVGKQPQDDYLRQIIMTIHPIEPDNPQFLRLLEHILRDREYDLEYRDRAVWCLGHIGMRARPYLPALAAAFRDDSRLEECIIDTMRPFKGDAVDAAPESDADEQRAGLHPLHGSDQQYGKMRHSGHLFPRGTTHGSGRQSANSGASGYSENRDGERVTLAETQCNDR